MPVSSIFSTDRFALKVGLFYATYFLFGGIQLPYFPLWLQSRGLDAQTIGLVIAAPMLARIVVTPLIAHAADRHHALRAALIVGSGGGAVMMVLVGLLDGGLAILIGVGLAACFFSPLLALSDAYGTTGLKARGIAYGPVRLWGSVSFIVANLGTGALLAVIAPDALIWFIAGALALTLLVALALDPVDVPLTTDPALRPGPLTVIKQPGLMAVVLAAALIQGSHALYYGFATLDWRAAGYSGVTIGTLWAAGVVAEIVLFAWSGRLPARLSPALLLAIGGAGAVLRWSITALEPPLAILLPLQVLHAASFAAAHLGAMAFLARSVPSSLAATAQGVLATTSGLVMACATVLSGLLFSVAGSQAYAAMTAMALIGLACALMGHRQARS